MKESKGGLDIEGECTLAQTAGKLSRVWPRAQSSSCPSGHPTQRNNIVRFWGLAYEQMVFGEIVIFWLPPCVKFSIFKRYHLFTFNILSEESVFTETPNEALYTIKMILIQIR